jgi:hypothetical protein
MTEPRIIAECRDYAQLVAALRAWIAELNVAGETIDDVAGLPLRYTAKLLGPAQLKGIGPISMGPLLGALGLKLVVAVDHETLARISYRLVKCKNARSALLAQPKRKRKGFSLFRGNPDLARMLANRVNMSRTPEQRSRLAKRAARERWRLVRLAGKAKNVNHVQA